MKRKCLSVRLHGKQAGILEQLVTGKLAFTYDASTTHIISHSMPIQEKPYSDLACEAYFGGLLPEGIEAKKAIGKQYGISFNNSFALLKAIGYDCAGAISFHEIDEPIVEKNAFALEGKIVSEDALYLHIKALPKKPLFLGFEGLRLSLAGVHDKAAICLIDGKIALPENGCPTTHILKPAISAFDGIVENEFICLDIAKKIGLPVLYAEIRKMKDITYLLTERYDRIVSKNTVERLHQEDFCQALQVVSARKYQNEGGPSFKDCFDLLKNTVQPAIDRNTLASGLIFNFLIGNMDAHGKNFSVLHQNASEIYLAPFYDLVCTQYYPSLSEKMAMKIGGEYEAKRVQHKNWEKLCSDIQYNFPALKQLIKKQSDAILNVINKNKSYYINTTKNESAVNKLSEKIINNIERTLIRLRE